METNQRKKSFQAKFGYGLITLPVCLHNSACQTHNMMETGMVVQHIFGYKVLLDVTKLVSLRAI